MWSWVGCTYKNSDKKMSPFLYVLFSICLLFFLWQEYIQQYTTYDCRYKRTA